MAMMYDIAPFAGRRRRRNFDQIYDTYPAFDLHNFGGLSGYGPWNGGWDHSHFNFNNTEHSVEQATRAHVEAQSEFSKAKEKYEEAKKKFEECEEKVKKAEQQLQWAKHHGFC
ncbi:hypothetical protein BDW02DRAFT_600094 [Decorospora gaudefroyi]|uniref:Uncharacterized protein n=1 Tax=Decorospora gaudefroyi TaxID=184978 RepID=A0A6A5K701_9PLEO|nr:hypothetical protein BDW02DRAFT_600094 [Decorospora gaudefroyi]